MILHFKGLMAAEEAVAELAKTAQITVEVLVPEGKITQRTPRCTS